MEYNVRFEKGTSFSLILFEIAGHACILDMFLEAILRVCTFFFPKCFQMWEWLLCCCVETFQQQSISWHKAPLRQVLLQPLNVKINIFHYKRPSLLMSSNLLRYLSCLWLLGQMMLSIKEKRTSLKNRHLLAKCTKPHISPRSWVREPNLEHQMT